MKNTIIFLIVGLLFLSCKNKVSSTDIIENDSIISVNIEEIKDFVEMQSNKNCGQTFDDFFEQFAKDSLFQNSRVKYPLKESYYEDLESSEITINMVSPSKYHYIDFKEDKNAMDREFDQYQVIIEKIDNKNVYYKNVGVDNGINIIYKFKLIDGCWYMIEIEDKSV
jgi:hypothetical protein